jgi:quinol monooxygenase YgiN
LALFGDTRLACLLRARALVTPKAALRSDWRQRCKRRLIQAGVAHQRFYRHRMLIFSFQQKERTMLTITAVIRVKQGCVPTMRDALLEAAANVRANEPETVGFFISQDAADPHVFTTYERFIDRVAMDRHNNSAVVARFFGIAKPNLEGEVTLVTGVELSEK